MTAEVTSLLLEYGADPWARDHRGRTPLDIAADYPHQQALALLQAVERETERGM